MIGTYINLSVPQSSDTMADVVSKTATCLGQLRDSIADKASPAGLNLNADNSYLGNRITNCGGVTLVDGNNPTATGSIYYHSGEFYAIDSTGTIKLTNLGQINLTSVGGIGGDYGGSNPALESYDTATGQYRFYTNGSTHTYGDVAARAVFLEGTGGTVKLAADATVTTNQIVNVGALPTSGSCLLTYKVSGNLLGNASSDTNTVTLGGNLAVTGDIGFGPKYVPWEWSNGLVTTNTTTNVGYYLQSTGTNWKYDSYGARLSENETVGQVTIWVVAGTGTVTYQPQYIPENYNPGVSDITNVGAAQTLTISTVPARYTFNSITAVNAAYGARPCFQLTGSASGVKISSLVWQVTKTVV